MDNENIKKINAVRYAEYYDMQPTFDELYRKSTHGKKFIDLMTIIKSEDNILLAYRNIKRNGGSYTSGIDKKTIQHVEVLTEIQLIKIITAKLNWYKPQPVKRVEIPKLNGKTRPLGIPTIYDRIVQQCIKQVMEPICEAKFHNSNYGFRPDRSVEHAISRSYLLMQKNNLHYVVDVDIKGFFDNVNHSKLIKQIWSMGIRDKKLLSVIKEMLKAPVVMPNGQTIESTKGTPQGGILSPLLANIVLNELDWWVSSQWETMPCRNRKDNIHKSGSPKRGHAYEILRKKSELKEMFIVRYADDFKIFCRHRKDAENVLIAVTNWLKVRLKLEISPEKSGITNLKKQYMEFLGFKLKVRKKSDRYAVTSHMSDKAIKIQKDKLKEQIKRIQKPSNDKALFAEINRYNAMVMGVHNYFKIATESSGDCGKIGRVVKTVINNRLDVSKNGNLNKNGAISKLYGKSKEMRYLQGQAIIPISYCKTKFPMHKKWNVCRYTPDGRSEKHKKLGVNLTKLFFLMDIEPKGKRSVEYYDNRISLYAAQNGRCAITGMELEISEIHCHHKVPSKKKGTDGYKNLVIVHINVHRLIHATLDSTIQKYITILTNREMYQKVNNLRKLCGNADIVEPI